MGASKTQSLDVLCEIAFPPRDLEGEKINENPSPLPPRHNVAAMRKVIGEDHHKEDARPTPTGLGQHCRGGGGGVSDSRLFFPSTAAGTD